MSFPLVQLTGGRFQDAQGNPVANGTLVLQLTGDTLSATGSGQVVAGYSLLIRLNMNGSIASGAVFVQANDLTNPTTKYNVQVYSADGRPVWANPHQWTVSSAASSVDVGTL